jgi:hypothetical protein
MRWHWQNLNEDRRGRKKGSGFWEGRAWFYASKRDWATCFHGSWVFGRRAHFTMLEAGINFYDPKDIYLHFGIALLFNFYLSLQGYQIMRRLPDNKRQIGFSFSDNHFRWILWRDPNEWHRGDRRQGGFFLDTLIKGNYKYSKETLEQQDVLIPMPEKSYPAHIEIFESTWRYPRWPWPKRMVRAEVEIPGGIPIPGKGENSWDMDDDALFGTTVPVGTVEQAIARVVESVMRDRRRYGGSVMWQAEDQAKA